MLQSNVLRLNPSAFCGAVGPSSRRRLFKVLGSRSARRWTGGVIQA